MLSMHLRSDMYQALTHMLWEYSVEPGRKTRSRPMRSNHSTVNKCSNYREIQSQISERQVHFRDILHVAFSKLRVLSFCVRCMIDFMFFANM